MSTITSFRDLDSWNVAMEMTLHVYKAIERLPSSERFELSSQMRRAAVSVPSNIAEGQACGILRRPRFHVRVALGSVAELETQLEICRRLAYLDVAIITALEGELARVGQLLNGTVRSLNRRIAAEATSAASALIACVWLFWR